MGAVTGGTLVVEGHLVEASLSSNHLDLHLLGNPEEDKTVGGGIYWDIRREASTEFSYSSTWLLVLCISLYHSREDVSQRYNVQGLVLGKFFPDENRHRWLAFFASVSTESSLEWFKSHQCSNAIIAIV